MIRMTTLGCAVITTVMTFQSITATAQKNDPEVKESPVQVPMVSLNSAAYEADMPDSIGGGMFKIIPGGILTFKKEKGGSFLLGGDGNMILGVNGKAVRDSVDYIGPRASEYMKISDEQYVFTGVGLKQYWKTTLKMAEGKFAGLLFRCGVDGKMIPGFTTTEQSKIYLPSMLSQMPAEWPYNSSTDIVFDSTHFGGRLAVGQLEFLLIRQRLVPNFGEGARIKISPEATPMTLVNADGSSEKVVKAGTFIYAKGAWKRHDPE